MISVFNKSGLKLDKLKSITAFFMSIALSFILIFSNFAYASSVKQLTWRHYSEDMEKILNEAYDNYAKDKDSRAAIDKVNEAYFGIYEKKGVERNVKSRVSGKRASTVEYQYSMLRKSFKKDLPLDEIKEIKDKLVVMLWQDSYALDGIEYDPNHTTENPTSDSSDSDSKISNEQLKELESRISAIEAKLGMNNGIDKINSVDSWSSFLQSLLIIVREGVEAILVVAAIIAYLIKSGNKEHLKSVYYGVLAAIVLSIVMAFALNIMYEQLGTITGLAQEVFEAGTMILAVLVLLYVGNWMLAKVGEKKWDNYIKGKLKESISKGGKLSLVFAAFLAVFREGAETILFYQSLITAPNTDMTMVWVGLFVGIIALAIIYSLVRVYSIKLPLKQFFLATSTLLYVMAFSFAGNAIRELQEASVIDITLIDGFPTFTALGIYPRVENLAFQSIVLIIMIISVFFQLFSKDKKVKN